MDTQNEQKNTNTDKLKKTGKKLGKVAGVTAGIATSIAAGAAVAGAQAATVASAKITTKAGNYTLEKIYDFSKKIVKFILKSILAFLELFIVLPSFLIKPLKTYRESAYERHGGKMFFYLKSLVISVIIFLVNSALTQPLSQIQ